MTESAREKQLWQALWELVEHIDGCGEDIAAELMAGQNFDGPYERACKLVGWTIPIEDEEAVEERHAR